MRSRILLIMLIVTVIGISPGTLWAEEQDLAPEAKSAILLDADTGTVLFEKNSREKLPPASITKIMTMILTMEALESGKIKYDEPVRVSEHAASMGGSQIFLEPEEEMTVHDLLKAVAIASANDASVALAEKIGGTEEAFVEMMNKRAKELGMKDTHFKNVTGLSAEGHYSTARDISIMSRELLKYPKITSYTRIYQDYLRKDSKKPFWLVNTNRLVRFYKGVDGLKTGFTNEARFCLAATAKRGNLRMIAVVMGEPTAKARNTDISRMLDYGFSQYTNHVVYKDGEKIAVRHVDKGEKNKLTVRSRGQFSILMRKGEEPGDYKKEIIWKELKAPIRKGQGVGKVQIIKDGRVIAETELLSTEEIPRASMWKLAKRSLKNLLFYPEEAEQSGL